VPDLTLLLVCPPEVAERRMRARGALDRMERQAAAFHARVADAFTEAAEPAWQLTHREVGPVATVDADGAVEAVARRIDRLLVERWPETFGVLVESE
jgi:dTMP kinase